MALSINLYIHGVPNGHRYWNANSTVANYLQSFYNGKSYGVDELMVVERTDSVSCYYTYIKVNKVNDCGGRSGAYVALTLRINAYYADLQNIYHILHAAYSKMCVGLITKEQDGYTRFCVTDFNQVTEKLQLIEKSILNYIREYSCNEDIYSLEDIISSNKKILKEVNLLECNKEKGIALLTEASGLLISEYYPSSIVDKQLSDKDNEIHAVRLDCKKQIEDLKKNHEIHIESLEKELSECQQTNHSLSAELGKVQQAKQSLILQLEGLEKDNGSLKKELKEEKNGSANEKLKNENRQLQHRLQDLEKKVAAYKKDNDYFRLRSRQENSTPTSSQMLPDQITDGSSLQKDYGTDKIKKSQTMFHLFHLPKIRNYHPIHD